MKRFPLAAALIVLALATATGAFAQTAVTVTACGSPFNTPVVGNPYPVTQDTTGKLCTSSTGSGGGPITAAVGSYSAGALVDGASATLGFTTDAAWGLSGASTAIAALKEIALQGSSSIPAGANLIGGTNLVDSGGTNKATVKAASTQPATTDTSVVVAESPLPNPVCGSTPIAINQTASTDLHTFTNKGYLCFVYISDATATQGWSLAEGTGTLCATGITYLIGGSGGTAQGSVSAGGNRTLIKMVNAADHLCLLQSGSTNISGTITYADQP